MHTYNNFLHILCIVDNRDKFGQITETIVLDKYLDNLPLFIYNV